MKTNPFFITLSRLAFVLSLALGLLPAFLYSQDPSRLDPGFGVNGVAVVTNGIAPLGGKVAVDSQGRVVTVGTTQEVSLIVKVIRYLPNGSIDTTFGSAGIVQFSGWGRDVAIDADDNIVIVYDFLHSGYKDIFVTRLLGGGANPGAVDTSFGPVSGTYRLSTLNSTPAATDSNSAGVVIQEDGRIVIVGDAFNPASTNNGTRDLIVVRLTPQGFVDPSFNAGAPLYFGNLQEEFAAGVAVDSQGRIFVAALHNAFARVYRVTANGLPDTSVGTPNGGFAHLDAAVMLGNNVVPTGIAVHSDDSVVVCGYQSGAGVTGTNKLWVAKYATEATSATWVTEEDFGADTEAAFDLAVQPDSKIVVAGYSSNGPGTAVIRYLSDGSRDTSFNQDFGGFATNLTSAVGEYTSGLAIQGNGGIVLAGSNSTSFFAARIGAPRLVTPAQLRFSSTRVGRTSKSQSLTLSNPGGAMLTGLQIRLLGSGRRDFQLLPPDETIAGGAASTMKVKFKPRRGGVRITDVQISTANAGAASVRLIGRGR